ncbi:MULTISPECIES: hypothetical protein [Segatella]|uniref:hypothetical protein n=1 Tax=Segatella TaxID=2974251 RepID=UPI0012DF7AC6|nr:MULTISPECIES: hypothetical protein [Segatella]UKK79334.1 hypothetical protein L6469_13305 [Segatella baroniae B14]
MEAYDFLHEWVKPIIKGDFRTSAQRKSRVILSLSLSIRNRMYKRWSRLMFWNYCTT